MAAFPVIRMAEDPSSASEPAAPAPVDEENAAEGDSMDESIDEGESLLKTEAPPEAGPGSPAPSDSVLSEAAKQKFNELIYWSNPKLTALTFLGLNGIFIVLVVILVLVAIMQYNMRCTKRCEC